MTIKKLLWVFLSIFLVPITATSQTISNAEGKTKVIYIGIKNPVHIEAVGYSCDDLPTSMSVDDCKATKVGDCNYNVEATKPGNAMLTVDVLTDDGLKTVDILYFDVKYTPDPVAILVGNPSGYTVAEAGSRNPGYMPVKMARAITGVIATLLNFDFDVQYIITAYKIEVLREGSIVFSRNNKGSKFDEPTVTFFGGLRLGDKLSISEIHAIGPDKKERHLAPLELTIE